MNSLRGLSFCAANEWIDGSTLFPSLHLPSFLPLLLPAQRCENQITPFWLLISFTREEAVHGKEGEKGKGIGEEQHVQHQQMAYCISINMFQLLQNKKKYVRQGIFLSSPHPPSLSWWPKIESVICGSGSRSVSLSLSRAAGLCSSSPFPQGKSWGQNGMKSHKVVDVTPADGVEIMTGDGLRSSVRGRPCHTRNSDIKSRSEIGSGIAVARIGIS